MLPVRWYKRRRGESSELRDRRLRPGAGTLRAEVVRNQRERLYAAMVAVVSEKGYEATTVADLVALSGVSRSDFYKHFASKQACFVAMVESLVEPMVERIGQAKVGADEERVREVFDTFIGMAVQHAATARVCIVELHAAGEEAERAIDRLFDAFEDLVLETSKRMSGREEMPPQIVQAVIGGLRKVLHTRLYRGEERELARAAPELWKRKWGLSYYPPPQPLRPRRRASEAPSRFEGYTPVERIARAVATVDGPEGLCGDEHQRHRRAGIDLAQHLLLALRR